MIQYIFLMYEDSIGTGTLPWNHPLPAAQSVRKLRASLGLR